MNSPTSTRILQKVCIAKLTDLSKQHRPFRIAEALLAQGYKCDIIGLASKDGNIIVNRIDISINAVDTRFNHYPAITRPLRIIIKFIKYVIYMFVSKSRIYCVHDVISIGIACLIKLFYPIIIIYAGDELEYARSSESHFIKFKNNFTKLFLKIAFRFCDIIMQADISRADALASMYNLKNVYYLRNVPNKKNKLDPINLRKKFNLPLSTVIIMYHGSIGYGRGIEQTIKSINDLKSTIHITFIIIGWGKRDYLKKIKHLIASCNSENSKIIINDGVDSDSIWNWIADADIGMANIENSSLSYYLAAPTKLYEYMMAGVPVILSDFPENRLVMKDADCGLLVNPADIEHTKQCILKLVQSPELRKKMGENGRRSALSDYNWEKEQNILIKVIRDVAS